MGNPDEMEQIRGHADTMPVFNKRLFTTQGTVLLTSAARQIMVRNACVSAGQIPKSLSKSELHTMRCVVDGLTLLHKGQMFVKDILSHVVSPETYGPGQHVEKQSHETQLSCYYIVTGTVMVTYDVQQNSQTRSVYQPDIVYHHGAGEYLGIVSLEGIHDDLSPPSTVVTKEYTEFLRIDRQTFHQMVAAYKEKTEMEKTTFLTDPRCFLSHIHTDAFVKILSQVSKVEFLADKAVLRQDEKSDFMHFVVSGRCELIRTVHVPDTGQDMTFHLGHREPFSFFGEECILSPPLLSGSHCTVYTATYTVLLRIHRSALEIVSKDQLYNVLCEHANHYPCDGELRQRGYAAAVWNRYKQTQIKSFLREIGSDHKIIDKDKVPNIQKQPLSETAQCDENLLQFTLNGSKFEPVARNVHPTNRMLRRTKTVPGNCRSSRNVLTKAPRTAATATTSTTVNGILLSTTLPTSSYSNFSGRSSKHSSRPITATSHTTVDRPTSGWSNTNSNSGSRPSSGGCWSLSRPSSSSSTNLTKDSPRPHVPVKQETDNKEKCNVYITQIGNEAANTSSDVIGLDTSHPASPTNESSSVLVSMKTEDVVRKAKAIAETTERHQDRSGDDSGNGWYTSLHAENERAKGSIVANKYRSAFLRRRMSALARKRQKEKDLREYERRILPGENEDMDEMASQLANNCSIIMGRSKFLELVLDATTEEAVGT